MRWLLTPVILIAVAFLAGAAPAASGPDKLIVQIDLSDQEMIVAPDGKEAYRWPVSTARPGHVTPVGTYQPQWFSRWHKSSIYNTAPMPFSIFFHGNYAIHGTDQINRLGRPASAGCVRLHPENAAVLWELVHSVGKDQTWIVVQP
jgi:lipoprotein-anchoring transpeptidase ErfK/SrfK